jgi:hypothetical protein
VAIPVDRVFQLAALPIIGRVAQDPCLEHVRRLPASELEAFIYCVLRHFSRWSAGDVQQLETCATLIGNICFVRSVPLLEAACLLYAIRENVIATCKFRLLREPGGSKHEATRFFDLLVFELLKGY